MPLPEDLRQLFKVDYTELYSPEIKLPRFLTDEFNKVLLSRDAVAINKYYQGVVLPYCYSADLERKEVEKLDREANSKRHKKNGAKVNESILEKHGRWQDEADYKWSRCPGLSKDTVAQILAKNEDNHWTTIRKYINKK